MMLSQKELAKRLCVSAATISKAFRNASDINAETKARILQEAGKLGFRHSGAVHQSAASGEAKASGSRFLGVLYAPRAGDSVLVDRSNVLYLDGLSEEANARGITLVVHQAAEAGQVLAQESAWPVAMREGLLGGLVLVYRFDPEIVRSLARRFAVVTITHWVPDAACDHVDSDHIGGMSRLVRHLAGLGHRKIGFMMDSGDTGYERSRYSSTVRAMFEQGLGAPAALWVGSGNAENKFHLAAQAVIDGMKDGITAWMGDSDGMALQVMKLLQERGVRVPEQVSLTGFDGFDQSLATRRRITTVRTPVWQMGREAIRLLSRRMENPGEPSAQMLLDTPLIVGDTTGPAPGS